MGGLFRHVLDLATEEAARGHDIGIIADSTTSDALTAERLSAIAPKLTLGLHLFPMSRAPGLGDLAAAIQTVRIARRVNAEVLHGHGAKGGAFARLAAAALKLTPASPRCYYTPHGGSLHFDPQSVEGRVYHTLEKVLGRVTDGLLFESAYSKRVYEERIGLPAAPVRIVPNGLSGADFAHHEPVAGAADFLFIGELRQLKGVDLLLQALSTIRKRWPVRAVIVGAGPDADAFKALAVQLGIDGAVTFTGALPARQAFALGRCLVVPSRAESFPYIVLEAAAAGIPVIATDVGGIPEIVAGTDTLLVAPEDAEALTAAMAATLAEPETARRKAHALKAEVARKFTIDAMTSAVLKLQLAKTASAARPVKLTQN